MFYKSVCHWCHVMERESFENEEIAEFLNRNYVCIKVDREERPDIDAVYMAVCQAMTGQGGWPLTVLMTSECRPFFAGTYFPPQSRYGQMGLKELLNAVRYQWNHNRNNLLDSAAQMTLYLKEQEQAVVSGKPESKLLHLAFEQFAGSFDPEYGGFGRAPKFPTPHNLLFLMDYSIREKEKLALSMAETTLVQMYRGGIFDHIGGGFSRYSTDESWLIPHFEKMLYDNALLAMAYTKAYVLTGRKLYSYVVRKILDYVKDQLTDTQGGFYCGQDADSDGVEGSFYVFTPAEIKTVLGAERGESFCRRFGITEQGNFEGKSIPNLLKSENFTAVCEERKKDFEELYEYRLKRTSLHRDDKILVSWNGWMICALARSGAALAEPKYVDMAIRAEVFLSRTLIKNGRLSVRYREGHTAGEGKLDDYACYILALIQLYQATFEADYLSRAIAWTKTMVSLFFDEERGGFYLTSKDGERLLVRPKETYDGAMPSGNSAAARVLQKLWQITGDPAFSEILEKQLCYLAGAMQGSPSGQSYALLTLMDVHYPSKELVVTISPACDAGKQQDIFSRLRFLAEATPGLCVLVKTAENAEKLARLAPYTEDYPVPECDTLFYLCSGGQCMPPVSAIEKLEEILKGKA